MSMGVKMKYCMCDALITKRKGKKQMKEQDFKLFFSLPHYFYFLINTHTLKKKYNVKPNTSGSF